VINNAQSAIISYGDDGRVLSANVATAQLMGWCEADMLDRPIT
jgi:hypothetical protein